MEESSFKYNSGSSIVVLLVFIHVFIIIVFFLIFYNSLKEDTINIMDTKIVIDRPFYEEIEYSDIVNIEIVGKLPHLIKRTYGSNAGSKLKGYFSTFDGKIYLNVNKRHSRFLKIVTRRMTFFLSNSQIDDLYNKIKGKILL